MKKNCDNLYDPKLSMSEYSKINNGKYLKVGIVLNLLWQRLNVLLKIDQRLQKIPENKIKKGELRKNQI